MRGRHVQITVARGTEHKWLQTDGRCPRHLSRPGPQASLRAAILAAHTKPTAYPHPIKPRTYLRVGLYPHAVTLQTRDRRPKSSWISLGFRRPSNLGSPLAAGKISRRGTQLRCSCTGPRHPRCIRTLSCRLGRSAGRAVPSGGRPYPWQPVFLWVSLIRSTHTRVVLSAPLARCSSLSL